MADETSTPPHEALQRALSDWRRVLGDAHVIDAGPELRAVNTATFATTQAAPAIIRPGSVEEVQRCVEIANAHAVAIYPVSRGKNWGLGSRVPARDRCVVMELARMDRILDHDEDLAHITVEPGVSFAQAEAWLRERGSRLFVNVTGGPPTSSLIGNAIERGEGFGPHNERALHACAMQVVLPTGELIHTGFAKFAGTHAEPAHRWGVGPALDGMFTQSNLGVVTRMTFWLQPLPRFVSVYRFTLAAVEPAVDALRQLRLEGTLDSPFALWNHWRVLSMLCTYPWRETGGETPLTRERMASVPAAAALRSLSWFGVGAFYSASEALAEATTQRVLERMRPVVGAISIARQDTTTAEISEVATFGVDTAATLFGDPSHVFALARGVPTWASTRSMYWRRPEGPALGAPTDPERDRCGVLWMCAAVPAVGQHLHRAAERLEQTCLAHGLEPMLAFVFPQPRVAYALLILTYDRDVDAEDARAMACHDAALATLAEAGYPPVRLGIQSMNAIPAFCDASADLARRLKQALDPRDVLAPGRYDWRDRWT